MDIAVAISIQPFIHPAAEGTGEDIWDVAASELM
jgi:hypothetical protein